MSFPLSLEQAASFNARLTAARRETACALKRADVARIRKADAAMVGILADAMVELEIAHGAATRAQLLDLGFTVAELSAHEREAGKAAMARQTRQAA